MADIFTSTGTLITPQIRALQIKFHKLAAKRAQVVADIAPIREKYSKMRHELSLAHPDFPSITAKILKANAELTIIDNQMSALTIGRKGMPRPGKPEFVEDGVEALVVNAQKGVNFRPGVATMGKPD